jgi:uncharacterized MAPEG superfamily protein
MTNDPKSDLSESKQKRVKVFIIVYPFALITIAILVNWLLLGINNLTFSSPNDQVVTVLILTTIGLLANHTWLMTATELTRLRYRLYATPEEWRNSGRDKQQASSKGLEELERIHNAHRNTTENTVYFVLLGTLFVMFSPTVLAASVWLSIFAFARLGYTYSYLKGLDNIRGIFMSLGLLSLFGMASNLLLALLAL